MYILGDEPSELRRLNNQSQLLYDERLFAHVKNGHKVLELGCGTGVNYAALRENKIIVDYTGIDCSAPCLEVASNQHQQARFIQHDINIGLSQLNLGQFDVIICKLILWSIKNPIKCLNEIRKNLKQNGTLYVFEPYSDGLITAPYARDFHAVVDYWHQQSLLTGCNPSIGIEIPSMLKYCGYSNIEASHFALAASSSQHEFQNICQNLIDFYTGEGRHNPSQKIPLKTNNTLYDELNCSCDFISDSFICTVAKV